MDEPVDSRSALLEESLERAATVLGDITAPAMSKFYLAHPDALASFEHHGLGNRPHLEAGMVKNALYWAMTWIDHPEQVIDEIGSSVPHHENTLRVKLPWYRGLVEAVIDVIADTIPPDRADETALWRDIRTQLGALIGASRDQPVLH
jgi:hypothetical protein